MKQQNSIGVKKKSWQIDAEFSLRAHNIAYRDYLCHWWHTENQKPLIGKTRAELDIFFAIDAALPNFRYQFRFRRPDYLKYNDLTIREYRLHSLSELHKLNPLLKYFVYGWVTLDEKAIMRMYVCHIEPLLLWLYKHVHEYPTQVNRDHSSAFKVVPFADLLSIKDIIAFSIQKENKQLPLL